MAALLIATLIPHSTTLAQSASADSAGPNVLMICVDDLACTLGCYGDPLAKTPHLDRLASKGVCFQNAYCQIPLCNPTRASLMTGMRPDKIRVYDLDRHFRDEVPDVITLPQNFQRAGYESVRVGKVYHYNVPASIGTNGFDDAPSWDRRINPKGRDKTDEALVINAEPHRKISAALSWLEADGTDEEQTDGMITSEAIKVLKESREKPLFLAVGFFRPHTPYIAPKRYFDLYPVDDMRLPFAPKDDRDDIPVAAFAHNNPVPNYGLSKETLLQARRAYYANVSFIDAQVGRLLKALDESRQAQNTIIAFWSDHGYHLGEHGGVWQKRTLFEESARSPLILFDPRKESDRGVCRRIVEYVDLYPTLSELAGINSPPGLEGRSLVPLMKDPTAPWDAHGITQVLRPADDRLAEPVMGCSIRTERYRFTQWGNGKHGEELYDHATDPGEFNNLALNPDPKTRRLMDQLQAHLNRYASGKTPRSPFNPPRL
ncbi:MAG: sulfatase [Planctomycetota bacterium]